MAPYARDTTTDRRNEKKIVRFAYNLRFNQMIKYTFADEFVFILFVFAFADYWCCDVHHDRMDSCRARLRGMGANTEHTGLLHRHLHIDFGRIHCDGGLISRML